MTETDPEPPESSDDAEVQLDAAIRQHVERSMEIERKYMLATAALTILAGALKWGWLGGILGFVIGVIVGKIVAKVAVAIHFARR